MSSSLHIFALPAELLQNITLRTLLRQQSTAESENAEQQDLSLQTVPVHGSRTCNVCLGAMFIDVEEQRAHFRSDWHRYNVKIRLRGGKPTSELDFAKLVDSLEDSISGSASDSDSTNSDESDAVRNLLQRAKISSRPASPSDLSPATPQIPLAWFHSPPATQIGVYKALFPPKSDPTSYIDELKSMQTAGGPEGRKWAMFMTAGGHFAGVIARVSRPEVEEDSSKTAKQKRLKRSRPDTEVLLHKTFHRYTTRRKQGGSQSVNDNAKGPAKSAGAQLRRYGEQALRDDIRNLLSDWADEIHQCERIWIRASASNRRIFLDYDDAVITKGDERLRTFPFPTRRPTQSELERCLLELTRVKTSHLTEEALREQDEAYLASLPKPKPKPQAPAPAPVTTKAKEPRLTKEEEIMREKWTKLLDMVVHGRLDALRDFWEREGEGLGGIDARIPSWAGVKVATLLQYAAQAGQEEILEWLLNVGHADPTIVVPSEASVSEQDPLEGSLETARLTRGPHRTAYDLAPSRGVRDIFRRSAGAHPEWWDWLGAGRVPSILSQEMEEEREEKKKVRRKGLKDKIKERESREKEHVSQLEEVAEEPVLEPPRRSEPNNGPRRLGGSSGSADAVAGLTPEMRARVERERRARAAEARLRLLRCVEMQSTAMNGSSARTSTGPATKKQRLLPTPPTTQDSQESFADVLARIQMDARGSTESEGGADSWERPRLKPIVESRDRIVFQQVDIDGSYDNLQAGPQIHIFGVTQEGHSILAHITGFMPYFYVAVPRGFQTEDIQSFISDLNSLVGNVTNIELVHKRKFWGYASDEPALFMKITTTDPKAVPRVRDEGETNFRGLFSGPVTTFESNIPFILRFMIDTKVVGMNWIEVPPGKYSLLKGKDKKSHCQIELSVRFDQFISHPPEGEWAKIAPLRILSFDIECAGRKGVFPEASTDPVIQIANMVTRQGEDRPFIRNIFTLSTCSHIVGSQVISFKDEGEMLQKWRDFVEKADPDLIIGYNIANFDLPYLLDRAKALKAHQFPYLGRLKNTRTQIRDTHFSSRAFGQRDSKEASIDGRLQLDVLQYMQREHKLRSYTLNSVCAQFLGEQKEDVHHSVITELQNGTPESRRRLAVYCLKDAYLPQRLMDKLMCFINYTEMARVTGVPFNYLLSRGQSIKVLSQLYRKANDDGYVIPTLKSEGTDEQYEGATVIEPRKGYYDVPIATLDFSSLYPSIMMAHNLCYTTLLDKQTIDRLNLEKDVDYVQTPNNDLFVKPSRRKGLLPTVLEDLISARKRAKADLKKETDPFKRAVLDGRQLALKISANSVYGFTGATIGKLPCLAISSSVTAYGRQMIEKTKAEVEAEYCVANGHTHNAEVIYGDTDSVMVRFGPTELDKVMAMGSEAAELVTKKFVKPIKLEFEKVYYPYLLINKKRYAGLYWTKPEKYDKMDSKGIETVRRDNCRLVSTVIETCLHKMLIDRDVKGAEDYTKRMISDLLQNRVDMSQLVITKALAKTDYTGKQAHVELAGRMKQRDAGSAPTLGDRVAYVIVKGIKGAAAYEKSEDPIYVLENNIPIDTKYYLENQLSKPLMRIFEPILGEKAASLLSGEHTRTIQIATPTVGGLMKFAVKTVTCLGCKTPLRANNSVSNGAVCDNCRPRINELYHKQVTTTSETQVKFARLWTQCQRCQGSLHQDVLCTSRDCPIFYMRKKAQKDVEDAVVMLERFDLELW